MVKVKVSELRPGLALTADVYGPSNSNVALLTAVNDETKTVNLISERGINLLKRNGVTEVDINVREDSYTFPDVFTKILAETIDTFYEKNEFFKISSYANLYDVLCRDEYGRFRQTFNINTDRYAKKENDQCIQQTSSEHIAYATNIAVALASAYNSTVNENEIIPINQVALACMLSEIGRYANTKSKLEILESKYEEIIKTIENAVNTEKNMEYFENYNSRVKPPKFEIPKKTFEIYDRNYIPLYSYLLCKKFNLDAVVSRGILYSGEWHSQGKGLFGLSLKSVNSSDDNRPDDDVLVGSKSVIISEIIHIASKYELLLYYSRMNCENRNIYPLYNDVFASMNRFQSLGEFHPQLLKLLYEIVPCYYVGQIVELSDGTYGRVKKNTFDLTSPVIEDINGNIIDDDVKIIGPAIGAPFNFNISNENDNSVTEKVIGL